MPKRFALALAILGLLAACTTSTGSRAGGAGETPTAGPTGATPTAAPSEEVEREILAEESPPEPPKASEQQIQQAESRNFPDLELRDFRFSPTSLQAKAGRTVNVRLVNLGTVEHNFTIVTPESGKIRMDVAPSRDSVLGFLAPKKAGSYTFYCRFHRDQGMVGTLVVR